MDLPLTGAELRSAAEWRALVRRHGVRPDKRLGQNFLFEPTTLRKIVAAAGLTPHETVLEIGAGVGSLTCALAQGAGSVIAVEFDTRLQAALADAVQAHENVRVVAGDVLALDLEAQIGGQQYAVVGNIPYNITSAVIRKLMEARQPARTVVLTIQDEVARRITSGPGEMSLLALSVQLYGEPRIVLQVGRGQFWPAPDVDSAVIRIDMRAVGRRPAKQVERIFTLARAGFGQRRKQMKNALAIGLSLPSGVAVGWLERAGIEPKRRAQSLSLEEWERLADAVGNGISAGREG
jgi:16S rRNA (adenine1518-N6/adenine1519-N6)-dimethyltransferase